MKRLFGLVLLVLFLTSCQDSTKHRLKVAATAVPHASILEQAKPILKESGIELEIIIIDDYQIPNRALADGEIDANFFQHQPFLQQQNKELGYDLISFTNVHLEPMGLYSKRVKTIEEVPFKGTIVLPNDPTNQARALLLLQKVGLITLAKEDISATVLDIAQNPKKLRIIEVDAAILPRALGDADIGAIPANFALQAGLSPLKDSLALEAQGSAFDNILVIRPDDVNREDLRLLKEALTSETIRNYIEQTYKGAVLPALNSHS